MKGSSVNRYLSLLRSMFNCAKKWGYRIGDNPVPRGKMFDEKVYERDRVLSFDEESRLLGVIPEDNHIRDCILIALHTGMRKGEILKLKWSHIDFHNHLIVLKPENTKAKRGRKIDINRTVLEILKRRRRLNGSEYVITYHGKPIHSIKSGWFKYVELAEIQDLTFHDLRRTFGTRLLEAGVNLVTISRLLGHSRIETTMTYLKPRIELGREAVSILDQLTERNQVYYQPLLPKEGKNLVNRLN